MLRAAMMEEASTDEERYAQQRMRDMHELIDKLMSWFDDVQRLSPETAMQLMGMGSAVTRLLDLKDKITGRGKSGTEA
jgi:DNA-binding transcriptional regulator GbsR (MarR family)